MIKIQHADSPASRIETFRVSGSSFGWAHIGWDAPIVRINGVTYLAVEVVANILAWSIPSRWYAKTYGGIKYGPGGRRLFARVSEKLIDDLGKVGQASAVSGRSERERARGAEIVDFAVALIDYVDAQAVAS